jgi:hypothetical protein
MATTGTGLFDNDSSRKAVDALVELKPGEDLLSRLVGGALELWFQQCDGNQFMRKLQKHTREMTQLPKPLFKILADITRNPDIIKDKHSRRAEHTAILGKNLDGWRLDDVFALPGAMDLVKAIVTRNADGLDVVLEKASGLSKKPLAQLGVLLELTELGIRHPKARVDAWVSKFDALDKRTTADRDFWDDFARRVRPAFDLLREK